MEAKDFLLIYCPTPSSEKAEEIAKHLLSLKLIACANLLPSARSFYRWKGQIESSQEWIIILKTSQKFSSQVFEEITKKHPYECPSICAFSMDKAPDSFLSWMKQSLLTHKKGS